VVLGGVSVATAVFYVAAQDVAVAQTVQSIVVQGNRRVEAETVRSYFKGGPNGQLNAVQIDEGLKGLIATGLFQDVRLSRNGGRLVVTVVEAQVINRVAFEGNKKTKDDQLAAEVQSKPRGALSRATVQSDTQRILEIYHRSGRFDVKVDPKIIELPNNRVDLVFEINEGPKTGIKTINFVGNKFYSGSRLKEVIKTSSSNLLSFLQTTDIYDADRLEADRDLLRRFYLKHGFADVRILSAVGEYDPAKKGFIVTFTIDEGAQYRVGKVDINSNVRSLDPQTLRSRVRLSTGQVYNADMVDKTIEGLTIEAAKRGYAFASVHPHADRNFESKVINLAFTVDQGARVYIERINIHGNTRTRDYVIRREFDIGEGDA
jgi:outer membrane protein insertion porin family